MGLLDSNIVRQASNSFSISGAATTAYSYLGGKTFDVSHYQIVCFQVKTITEGVKILFYGGITTSFRNIVVYDRDGQIYTTITKADTYYAEVSNIKVCGFYILNGVENGEANIDVVLKCGSLNDLKPIQSLYSETKALTAGSASAIVSLHNYSNLFSKFKFITVCAKFSNNKETIALSTGFRFTGVTNPLRKIQEEVSNTNTLYSDWIPMSTPTPVVVLDFTSAASEGDTVYIEIFGIR